MIKLVSDASQRTHEYILIKLKAFYKRKLLLAVAAMPGEWR